MILRLNFKLFINIFLIFSCSKKDDNVTVLKEKNLEAQMIEVYNQGMKNLRGVMLFMPVRNLMKRNCYIHNQYGRQEQFLWRHMVIFLKDTITMR